MQTEIDAEPTGRPVRIIGVNDIGLESGNAGMTADRTLPWLQPEAGQDVWLLWGVAYRDVVIIGPSNEYVGTFNLTTYDLGNADNYAALMAMLRNAAGE